MKGRKDNKSTGAFIVLLFILGVAVLFLTVNQIRSPSDILRREMVSFQQAIGGVGLGAVMIPAWNFSDYDPRLQQAPGDLLYPIPAGYSYSPDRLSMVTFFGVEKEKERKRR